jgi:hypothetical protein
MAPNSRIVLYKYVCINADCTNHQHQLIKKLETESAEQELCQFCFCPMKQMGEVPYGGIGGNFRQSSPAQRQAMLTTRASKHFATSGLAEHKRALGEEYKRQAVAHFKGD